MKTKFQNFNLGEVEVLTQAEQSRVKGGYPPNGGGPGGYTPPTPPTDPGKVCYKGIWEYFLNESTCHSYGGSCITVPCPTGGQELNTR